MTATKCMLEQYSFEVDTAIDGLEAINLVKGRFKTFKSTYAMILMDYNMPQCTGYQATRVIRKYLSEQE